MSVLVHLVRGGGAGARPVQVSARVSDRMDAVGLPWVFDENNRPSLLEEKDDGVR
jgi:hypothetical protein